MQYGILHSNVYNAYKICVGVIVLSKPQRSWCSSFCCGVVRFVGQSVLGSNPGGDSFFFFLSLFFFSPLLFSSLSPLFSRIIIIIIINIINPQHMRKGYSTHCVCLCMCVCVCVCVCVTYDSGGYADLQR